MAFTVGTAPERKLRNDGNDLEGQELTVYNVQNTRGQAYKEGHERTT